MISESVDRHDKLELQRRRLAEIYQPRTSREMMLLDELAQVYQEKEEFEKDHALWMKHEADTALETIQRQEADDFLKLQRQWPKAPAVVTPILGQSLNGAIWLVEFWQMIVARLAPKSVGPVPGMDQACQTLLALGFSARIQELSEAGWWWATRFLAIQQERDLAIAAWLRKSGTCDRVAETQQARHKLYDPPDPNTARKELYDEAVKQAEHWSRKLQELRQAEPARLQAQMARARCMGLKTPGLATCLNNAFRLRDAINRAIKFAEDRLARAPKQAEADARYYKRMARMEEQISAFFPPRPNESIAAAAAPTMPDLDIADLPEISEPGRLLEEKIVKELMPRMAASAPVQAAPPQPRRPMSNRKKRLAKMAAREEKALMAALAMA